MASISTVDGSGADLISTVHPDILCTHILSRLDGPTLASAAATSSQLHALSTQENLWREICTATWPSIENPRVRHIISTFPSGHRSFFADSYPLVEGRFPVKEREPSITGRLISAVDLYHSGNKIYSKVIETTTSSDWFMCSPFRVELLDAKESVPTRIRNGACGDVDTWATDNLTLNWILIDPTRKRAADVSSGRPVSARRNWLMGELQVRFTTVVEDVGRVIGPCDLDEREMVEVTAVVTCMMAEEGKVHVRDVRLEVVDMEGKGVIGRDSLVIFRGMMEGRRRPRKEESGNSGRYEEFEERKRRRRERKERREKVMDMGCIALGITLFLAFWVFVLFR